MISEQKEAGLAPAGARVAPDYSADVQHIKNGDIPSVADVVMRLVVVTLAGVALYALTGSWMYLAWAGLYVSTNTLYSLYLNRLTGPIGLRRYAVLVVMNMITSTSFAAMPVYLWLTTQSRPLEVLAVCGVFGHAMYNLSRHTRLTPITVWDAVILMGSVGLIGWHEIREQSDLVSQGAIAFGCIAACVYYLQAQVRTVADREALDRSRSETLEAQKQSAMGQITAGVAHDFNNKLTVIQGNIELAKISEDPAERAELLDEASRASRQAADVVAHMQAFARKSRLAVSAINLRAFCHDLTLAVEGYLPENISFSVQIDDTLGDIVCDRALLRTALLNLALNARDAMDGRGGQIALRIAPALLENWSGKQPDAPGPFLRFDVTDEGPGLPVSEFQRVQEPFYTTKPKATGTGLGLSLVKGFAEQIGGAVMLRNRVKGGLEISLLLPQTTQG